jgi:quinol monooxygenase YgiN
VGFSGEIDRVRASANRQRSVTPPPSPFHPTLTGTPPPTVGAGAYGAAVVIVTGSVTARDEHVDEVERLSLEHVRRSRTEPGCLLHSVHRDVEDRRRFVFIEHWADADALRAHFGVPASRSFVEQVAALASAPP